MPYLPSEDILVRRMEKQWGSLNSYRGINSTIRGTLLIPGVQLGKLWIGVQPLLGLEGDPMRLLFERDLTPHPQYAASYKWLQQVGCTGTRQGRGHSCAGAGAGACCYCRGIV
jgi:magnesium chelatase subunit H